MVVCVPDLRQAVEQFEERHGVSTVSGGRHRGHGTTNRLVPLGDSYLELVAVVDDIEASANSFGNWVASRAGRNAADAVALGTDDLDAVCERLDLQAIAMSRQNAAGDELSWRVAGLDHALSSGMPFFIQ